jgi:PEP-CTERM motif
MKSKLFLMSSAVALGLGAMSLAAPAARAELVYTWSGTCVLGCPVGENVSAELDLNQDYVFGTPITNGNFEELTFRSSTLNLLITTLDDPTIGINQNGSLTANAIAFESGANVFSFQVLSGGGLNWTAAGSALTLRGLGASGFSPAGVLSTPEPSTWAMMLLGFVGLGFAGYRSIRRSSGRAIQWVSEA